MADNDDKKEELFQILETRTFSEEDIDTLIKLIKFYEKYEVQLKILIEREVASEMWHSFYRKLGSTLKWILSSFILLVTVLQGWQHVVEMFFKDKT